MTQLELPVRGRDRGTDDAARFQVKIGGLHCSFCVGTLETAVGRRPGVESVNVSLAHEEALITYDPARIGPADLVETIRDIGYIVRDPARVRSFEDEEAELRTERARFLLAAAATVIALGLLMAGAWMGRPVAAGPWVMLGLALDVVQGGELRRQLRRLHSLCRRLDVVPNATELDGVGSGVEERPTGTRVPVLGLAGRADIDEARLADPLVVGTVGVAADDHVGVRAGRDPGERGVRFVLV